jgi:hypothetical protein
VSLYLRIDYKCNYEKRKEKKRRRRRRRRRRRIIIIINISRRLSLEKINHMKSIV